MSRIFAATVAAALALPLLALAALIGEQEAMLSGAAVVNVPVRGDDPATCCTALHPGPARLGVEREPAAPSSYAGVDGAACVLAADAPKPRLRFIAGWKAGDRAGDDCRMIIAGRGWAGQGGIAARFVPANLDAGGGQVRLFVPEDRAADLEQLLIQRPAHSRSTLPCARTATPPSRHSELTERSSGADSGVASLESAAPVFHRRRRRPAEDETAKLLLGARVSRPAQIHERVWRPALPARP